MYWERGVLCNVISLVWRVWPLSGDEDRVGLEAVRGGDKVGPSAYSSASSLYLKR